MKSLCFERNFYFTRPIGIPVNYKSRGGEWGRSSCGIDVHKTFVVARIASTDSKGVTTYKRHPFSTFTKGLKELSQRLCENNGKDICMESTGKYWISVFNVP